MFPANGNDCPLFVATNLRHKMPFSCQDESTVYYLGSAQMTSRFQQNYYWQNYI